MIVVRRDKYGIGVELIRDDLLGSDRLNDLFSGMAYDIVFGLEYTGDVNAGHIDQDYISICADYVKTRRGKFLVDMFWHNVRKMQSLFPDYFKVIEYC